MHRKSAWLKLFALAATLGLSLSGMAASAGAQTTEKKKEEKKQAEKKTDKSKKDAAQGSGEALDISAERKKLTRTLRAFGDAFEGGTPRRITEMIDERFYDFPRFEDQVTQFLQDNREIRMHFRESTSEVKGDKATLIVDADMIFATKANPTAEQKRRERIQFDFVRTSSGWKIYEISPRSFFVP